MAGGGVDAGGFLLHADWPYNENTIIRNALMYAEQKYNERGFYMYAIKKVCNYTQAIKKIYRT